jgi:hypothetical protein
MALMVIAFMRGGEGIGDEGRRMGANMKLPIHIVLLCFWQAKKYYREIERN